jgi:hypothetical protein
MRGIVTLPLCSFVIMDNECRTPALYLGGSRLEYLTRNHLPSLFSSVSPPNVGIVPTTFLHTLYNPSFIATLSFNIATYAAENALPNDARIKSVMNTWILPDDQRLNRIAFSVVRSNQFLAKF